MLVGVMSDTHDDIMQTKKAVSRFNREGVEQVLQIKLVGTHHLIILMVDNVAMPNISPSFFRMRFLKSG